MVARPVGARGTVASVFQIGEPDRDDTRRERGRFVGKPRCRSRANLAARPRSPRRGRRAASRGASHVELSGVSCSASASRQRSRSSPGCAADEPTSQLDLEATETFSRRRAASCAVVLSERRVDRALAVADRVVMMEEGRSSSTPCGRGATVALEAAAALRARPAVRPARHAVTGRPLVGLEGVQFSYGSGPEILAGTSVVVRRRDDRPRGLNAKTAGRRFEKRSPQGSGTVRRRQ